MNDIAPKQSHYKTGTKTPNSASYAIAAAPEHPHDLSAPNSSSSPSLFLYSAPRSRLQGIRLTMRWVEDMVLLSDAGGLIAAGFARQGIVAVRAAGAERGLGNIDFVGVRVLWVGRVCWFVADTVFSRPRILGVGARFPCQCRLVFAVLFFPPLQAFASHASLEHVRRAYARVLRARLAFSGVRFRRRFPIASGGPLVVDGGLKFGFGGGGVGMIRSNCGFFLAIFEVVEGIGLG